MRSSWQSPDLDEIRPDRFVVNNEKVHPLLRGEGQREGVYFHLQSTRRDGWVARLRAAGFNVRTLLDRVNALASVRPDVTLGPEGVRLLGTARERIAAWDPDRLRWRDLPVEAVDGGRGVRLRVGEPVRRRRSRSGGDYFIATEERPGWIGLQPVKESEAILLAYSLMVVARRPAVLRFTETRGYYIVPDDQALLPEQHREALNGLSQDADVQWTFAFAQAPLVERVFEQLGIELERRS